MEDNVGLGAVVFFEQAAIPKVKVTTNPTIRQ
jgi:hypothetical protein